MTTQKHDNRFVPVPTMPDYMVDPRDLRMLLERGRKEPAIREGEIGDRAGIFALYDEAFLSAEFSGGPPSNMDFKVKISWNKGTTWHYALLQVGYRLNGPTQRLPYFGNLELETLPNTRDLRFVSDIDAMGKHWIVRKATEGEWPGEHFID